MNNRSDTKVPFSPREKELSEKWEKHAKVFVNDQQHNFDTPERQEQFNRSLCQTEEEWERFKLYRNEWYRRPNEFDPGAAPLAVTCELVSFCNLNCPMCYTMTEEFQDSVVGIQRMLPWHIVKAIIDECAMLGVPSILFSWRGESTLYRGQDEHGNTIDIADVFHYARKKGILEITCLSNGQTISDELITKIVHAEPSWISFSVDGLFDVYNKIRTPVDRRETDYDAFAMIVSRIKKFVAVRESLGQKRPRIRTNSIYPPISADPQAYHSFLASLGVDWITVNALLDFRGEQLPEDAVLPQWICQYPWQRLTIAANGTVLPCTGAHNEDHDLILGRYKGSAKKKIHVAQQTEEIDIPEVTIASVWKSTTFEEIRKQHKEYMRTQIRTCRNCRHGARKNGVEWVPADWDMETMEWKGRAWKE